MGGNYVIPGCYSITEHKNTKRFHAKYVVGPFNTISRVRMGQCHHNKMECSQKFGD